MGGLTTAAVGCQVSGLRGGSRGHTSAPAEHRRTVALPVAAGARGPKGPAPTIQVGLGKLRLWHLCSQEEPWGRAHGWLPAAVWSCQEFPASDEQAKAYPPWNCPPALHSRAIRPPLVFIGFSSSLGKFSSTRLGAMFSDGHLFKKGRRALKISLASCA